MKFILRFKWLIVGVLAGLFIGSSTIYLLLHEAQVLPNFLTAIGTFLVALIFGFWTLHHTKEKFRLDLFEKRWEIYEQLLNFCSDVAHHGEQALHPSQQNLEQFKRTMNAAQNSFQGKGWHKSKSLFGKDVIDIMQGVNKAWAHISTWSFDTLRNYQEPERTEIIRQKYENIGQIISLVSELPDKLRPYLYFGDYKTR